MVYLVLVLFLVTAGVAPYFGRAGALALVVVSLVWLPVNHPIEGRVLIVLTRENGVTQADMLSVAGFLLAALVLILDARN